jgi:hypothetical protein
MRDHRGRLPKMRRASVSVQQVGRGQPRSLRCDGYAGDAPQVDKFSSSLLGVFGVAVDRERSLTAHCPGRNRRPPGSPRLPEIAPGEIQRRASIASQQGSYPYKSSPSLQL